MCFFNSTTFTKFLFQTQKAHKVTQFHITCWRPDGHCSNLKSVTDVIEEMTKVQIRSGNKPIVVHCSDTVTRSGMFCAIATTIERCKTEGVVDVFQVVKALRVQKPGAVPTVVSGHMHINYLWGEFLKLLCLESPSCRKTTSTFLTQFWCIWSLLIPTPISRTSNCNNIVLMYTL